MNRQFLTASLFCLIFITSACGSSGNDDTDSELAFKGGRYAGEAVVTADEPGTLCDFYAGTYPIEWNYVESSSNTYQVFDGDFQLADASVSSDGQEAVVEFTDVENYVDAAEVSCRGTETVTASPESEDTVVWEYEGHAVCDNGVTCSYSGEGVLERQQG